MIKTPQDLIDRYYLELVLNSPLLRAQSETNTQGVGNKNLVLKFIRNFVVPIPPLAEQRRIVSKVDELLGLCDELETRQGARRELRERLVQAALDQLLASRDPADFATHWQRLQTHFDTLFNTVEAVGRLRNAILQLAIRGKLVTRDDSEEPASRFVEKVIQHKSKLALRVRAASMESEKDLIEPFSIPATWSWQKFGTITICRDGERIPIERSARASRAGKFDYYGASGVIDKIDNFLFDKPLLLIGEDGANLVNRSTPIAFIAQGKYWVNNHAHVLDGITFNFLQYLEVYINAIDLKPYVTGTAQPKMNQAKMNSIPIAVPPENEQLRIVEKVRQLLSSCDEIQATIAKVADDGKELLAHAVQGLLGSTTR